MCVDVCVYELKFLNLQRLTESMMFLKTGIVIINIL